MPSKSRAQAHLMSAVAHGMKGSGVPVKVAKDFLHADEAKGRFEHSRTKHSAKAWADSKPLHRASGGFVYSEANTNTQTGEPLQQSQGFTTSTVSQDHEVQQRTADRQAVKPRQTPVVNAPGWKDVLADVASRVTGRYGRGLSREVGPTDVYKSSFKG